MSALNSSTLVQKLWNYCNGLCDDGMSYGDYSSKRLRAGYEQLTSLALIFNKSPMEIVRAWLNWGAYLSPEPSSPRSKPTLRARKHRGNSLLAVPFPQVKGARQ